MNDPEVANRYTFEGDDVTATLLPGMAGEPTASLSVRGTEVSDLEVSAHGSHTTLSGVTRVVHDSHITTARLRIPTVHLVDREPVEVTALLSIVTSHTNIAGLKGVRGPLETYDAALVTGTADLVQTI